MMGPFLLRFLLATILACGLAAGAWGAAAPLPLAEDFSAAAKDARARRVPVLVAFMQKTCPYCAVARRDFLDPMRSGEAWRDKVIMLEVDVDSHRRLRDFDGQSVTHRDFARRFGVKRVPTIIVLDDRGAQVAPPIEGLLADDFYRLYIEQAVEAGLVRLRRR